MGHWEFIRFVENVYKDTYAQDFSKTRLIVLGLLNAKSYMYSTCHEFSLSSGLQKSAFKDASCCLFIFDIVHFNGETLMDRLVM